MFKLSFDVHPLSESFTQEQSVLLLGSCFSENMGQKFEAHKFTALTNPFGTIYNPLSIFRNLRLSLEQGDQSNHRITEHAGVFYSWDTHSAISSLNATELASNLDRVYANTGSFFESADWLIITPGTAWVYALEDSAEIVANCHKHPQHTFRKRLLTTEEIMEAFQATHALLQAANPNVQILFTVSPVRHIRDGLVENNQSKSILLTAVHEIIGQNPNCHYFPAYEIMIDELRDYRFYAEDMIHPSQQAIDYIWGKFVKAACTPDTQQFLSEWQKIRAALNHRPFHPQSEAHQQFLKVTLSRLERLSNVVDVQAEIATLKNQIDP